MAMAEMTYHRFGRTDLQLSRVGLGAGGPSRLGTSQGADEASVEALIGRARDLGINHIDTARAYGTEAAIGRALKRLDAPHMMVATKVHWFDGNEPDDTSGGDRDPLDLVREVEASLADLGRDHIEIFQFHAVLPDQLSYVVDRLLPVAHRLQQQGKIGHIGITEDPSVDHRQQMAQAAVKSGHFDTLMVQYSILDQVADGDTFAATQQHDVGVFCMSAARAAFTDTESLHVALQRFGDSEPALLEKLIDGGMVADFAFRFAAAQSAIDVVLVGTGRQQHLRASTAAILSSPLPSDQLSWLRQRYGKADGHTLWLEWK
jgi:aryl-alcohol dehydrogenase-like predicted oxidoreductase